VSELPRQAAVAMSDPGADPLAAPGRDRTVEKVMISRLPTAGRAGRPVRAFSLLELVVVAALSSIFLLMLVRWVFTLNAATGVSMDTIASARAAAALRSSFSDDANAAVACGPWRTSPIASITPDRASFYIRAGADGGAPTQLVTWAMTPGARPLDDWTITRTLSDTASGDQCAASGVGVTQTLAENLAPIQVDVIAAGSPTLRPGFQAVTDGDLVTDPTQAWGVCDTGNTAARCRAQALAIHWVLNSTLDGAAPSVVARTYTFTAATAVGYQ